VLLPSLNRQAAENGASLEVQKEACERYCQQNGLDVVAEYQDIESGLHNDRPQYQQALTLAKSGDITHLVVWRLDRLGRDAHENLGVLKSLKKGGVSVTSVTQPSESVLVTSLLGVLAEEESRQISTRTLATKQRRTQAGLWQNQAPFGYQLSNHPEGGKYLVPHPTEGPIVTELFARYASGKVTLGGLQKWLAERGIKRSYSAISYVLKSPLYLGRVRHGRYSRSPFAAKPGVTEYQGKHEALADQATFDVVQERLAKNFRRKGGGVAPRYLFASMVFCVGCGARYVGKKRLGTSGKLEYLYRCGRKQSFGDCLSHSISEPKVKAAVLPAIEAVLGALSEADIRTAVLELRKEAEAARNATSAAYGAIKATVDRLEAKLTKLEDGWLDGLLTKERYLSRRDALLAELGEAKAKLTAETRKPSSKPVDYSNLLALAENYSVDTMNTQAWRDVIEALVEKIEVVGSKGQRQAAVKVTWQAGFDTVREIAEAMP
jgi:site-specific DNA recombinase